MAKFDAIVRRNREILTPQERNLLARKKDLEQAEFELNNAAKARAALDGRVKTLEIQLEQRKKAFQEAEAQAR